MSLLLIPQMRQPAPTQADSTEASCSTAHNLKPAEMLALAAVAKCIDLTGILAAEPAMCRDLDGRNDSHMTTIRNALSLCP